MFTLPLPHNTSVPEKKDNVTNTTPYDIHLSEQTLLHIGAEFDFFVGVRNLRRHKYDVTIGLVSIFFSMETCNHLNMFMVSSSKFKYSPICQPI